jgi:REP element-mobilizing transposase RayT
MAWPLRKFEPLLIYFVTVRCFQGRLLLCPSRETNDILGGVLARAVRTSGVELFVFSFASNHLHMLVRARASNLPDFMQYLLTNISKKIGKLRGWRGSFWERRYSAEPVLDEEALLERVRYIIAHGVKEGLVRTWREWPGLNSVPEMLGKPVRSFRWFNWSRRWAARSTKGPAAHFDPRFTESESLTITPLPVPRFARRSVWHRFVRRALQAIDTQGRRDHPRVLGRVGVLCQDPQHRPERPKRTPRPWCHTVSAKLRAECIEGYRVFRRAFDAASARWRTGDVTAVFPKYAFRPFLRPPRTPTEERVALPQT